MYIVLADTTRKCRENEVDGYDYCFMDCSVREFREQCDRNLFLEAGMYQDNGYGTKFDMLIAIMEKVNVHFMFRAFDIERANYGFLCALTSAGPRH